MSFMSPSKISPTTGRNHHVSSRPQSRARRDQRIVDDADAVVLVRPIDRRAGRLPDPLEPRHLAVPVQAVGAGEVARTDGPVRARPRSRPWIGPSPTRSGPSPSMSVVCPTVTPATSVMALFGPGVPRPIAMPVPRSHPGIVVPAASRRAAVSSGGDPAPRPATPASSLVRARRLPAAIAAARPIDVSSKRSATCPGSACSKARAQDAMPAGPTSRPTRWPSWRHRRRDRTRSPWRAPRRRLDAAAPLRTPPFAGGLVASSGTTSATPFERRPSRSTTGLPPLGLAPTTGSWRGIAGPGRPGSPAGPGWRRAPAGPPPRRGPCAPDRAATSRRPTEAARGRCAAPSQRPLRFVSGLDRAAYEAGVDVIRARVSPTARSTRRTSPVVSRRRSTAGRWTLSPAADRRPVALLPTSTSGRAR